MKSATITRHKLFKSALGAFIRSAGLQIIVVLLGAWRIGNLTGFRYLVNFIYTSILVPYMLAEITLSNVTRLSGNAIETLSWTAQFGTWFAIFYALLLWRSQQNKENG